MKKAGAFLAAMVMTVYTASVPVGKVQKTTAYAAGSYDMNVIVDLAGERKEISPLIYGVNQYGNEDYLKDLHVNSIRQGGNRMTAYNWENNASNAGSDWEHSSDDNLSKSDEPADCVQVLSKLAKKNSVGYKLTTLQLAGYVAADKKGAVDESESAPSERWNEAVAVKGAPFADEPDLTDGKVYMDEYVNYIIKKLGDSKSETGIQGYSLDNEPALWMHTHSRIHPQPVGAEELTEKSVAVATAVKKLDPNAEIFGPSLYGYTAFDHLADDENSDEWEKLRDANGYHWYIDYYLDSMKKASDEAGVRLLDVLDIHYYSESARGDAADRVQSVRTLYEKGFKENSWIGKWCQENVPILPTIKASIDKYFPGTKLGITEYNFKGANDVSGTIAQAEALGCYADQGVYFATLWDNGPFILSGMKLYTNYDGNGGCFGDTLVSAKTDDVSLASTYAAVNSDSDSKVTVMLTNKSADETENASINIKNSDKEYKSAAVYAVFGDSEDIKLLDVVKDFDGNNFKVDLPAYSAAMIVVSDNATEFDGLKKYDEIKIEVKKETFDDPMSMVNANGFVEIPITDPKHLSKIIITGDVASSAGSGWGNAGCAVCINAVDENGTAFWTYKDYMLNLGNDSKATVKFDGTLKNEDKEDVKAVIADGKIELQKWWDSSEKKEAKIDDEITIKYKSVQVVYEYKEEDISSTGTTTTTAATSTTSTTTTTTTAPQEDTTGKVKANKLGDANCDGNTNMADSVLIMQAIANADEYGRGKENGITEQGWANADVTGGGVTMLDAAAIQSFTLEIIKSFDEYSEEV